MLLIAILLMLVISNKLVIVTKPVYKTTEIAFAFHVWYGNFRF